MNKYPTLSPGSIQLNKFVADKRGSVAMLFGLMAIALFLMIGGAVDFGRWQHARAQTIAAMDAAVLAAGRSLQVKPGDSNAAVAAANSFYNQNVESRLPLKSDTISFSVNDDGLGVSAKGNAYIETPFLSLTNINELPILDTAGADYSKSEVAVGANAELNLEISMMLDVTGSMSGQKLEDMQEAAKDLIEIVVWDDQSKHTSKVALVPFSQAVNVGSTFFNAITNQQTSWTITDANEAINPLHPVHPQHGAFRKTTLAALNMLREFSFIQPAYAKNNNGNNGNGNGNSGNNGNGNSGNNGNGNNGNNGNSGGDDDDNNNGGGSALNYSPCVVDRGGNATFTDAAPGPGAFLSVFDVVKNSNSSTKDSACKPGNVTIQPLTNNKNVLNAKIDSFVASGMTAGHVGTAFAWYTLSPSWAGIWPQESRPAAYNDQGTKKIAILMTDGDYNVWYNGSARGTSSEQAQTLCSNMKDDGIDVYAVAFDVNDNSSAAEVMQSCASNPGQYYNAEDGEDLKQAFRDIALKISSLYLSN